MATTNELQIIRSNPVNDGLGAFRRLFEVTRVDLGIAVTSGAVQAVFSTAVTAGRVPFAWLYHLLMYIAAKNLVVDLILALQSQPAARILPSRNSRGTLLGDLSAYVTLIDSNNLISNPPYL